MKPLPQAPIMVGNPVLVCSQLEFSGRVNLKFIENPFFLVINSTQLKQSTSPACRFIKRESIHHQSTNISNRYNNPYQPPSPLVVLLEQHAGKEWYTSDLPQQSPTTYQIQGFCYPYDTRTEDLGVLLTAANYQNGFYIFMQWMDVGDIDGGNGPDWWFHNNRSEFFLELNYGTEYKDVVVDTNNLTFTLI